MKIVKVELYLQGIAGEVVSGLVPEGLAKEEPAFVVDLIPVFAIAYVQTGFGVVGALLVSQMDLDKERNKDHDQDNPNPNPKQRPGSNTKSKAAWFIRHFFMVTL